MDSCYMLGMMLEQGMGVERSGRRSRAMYSIAASMGDSDSESDLQLYYHRVRERGRGREALPTFLSEE